MTSFRRERPSLDNQIMWWYSWTDFVSLVLSSFLCRLARISFLDKITDNPRTRYSTEATPKL